MIYLFQNPKTNETCEVSQPIDADHRFIDETGLEWERVFVNPNLQISAKIDPMSKDDFLKKTRAKNYNLGEVMDLSAEASEKRAGKMGRDEVKEAAMKKYEKLTDKPHPERPKKTKWVI